MGKSGEVGWLTFEKAVLVFEGFLFILSQMSIDPIQGSVKGQHTFDDLYRDQVSSGAVGCCLEPQRWEAVQRRRSIQEKEDLSASEQSEKPRIASCRSVC